MIKEAKHIKLAADSQAILPLEKELLPALKNKFSQEEFTLLPADSHMAKEYILNHIVDAAFIGSRLCSNSMLNYHHLYDECLMLCVPENLLNAYGGLPEKSESPKIPFILPRTGLYFRFLYDNIMQKLSITISKSYEAEDFLTMKRLMEQGFGAALLPGRMAREAKGCTVYPAPDDASFGFYFAVPRYHEEEPEFDYALKKAREILSPQASLAV